MLSPEDKNRLETIKIIRVTNNDYWMKILEIALEADPERTKAVLSAIRSNDEAVCMLIREIADDNRQKKDRSEPDPVYRR